MAASSLVKIGAKIATFVKANKSTIMVCGGLACGGAAVVTCGKATVKSVRKVDIINNERMANNEEPLTKKEIIKECAPNYISTGVLCIASVGLIGGAHRLTLKQLSLTTGAAKLAKDEYESLRDAIEEELGDEESKGIKDAIIDKFCEKKQVKMYGDSSRSIDRFGSEDMPYGFSSKGSYGKNTGVERYKDKYGVTFEATRADIRYLVAKVQKSIIEDSEYMLADMYSEVDATYPEATEDLGWNDSMGSITSRFDISLLPDYDADGLFWKMNYSHEPEKLY